jgi:hypothetical protein
MAIGLMLKFAGGTQEQYNAVHDHMNIEDQPPEGLIFHSSGPIDGGWRVIDVWHSRNAFDQFTQTRLTSAAKELGDRAFLEPPDIQEFSVHNYLTPPL